MAHIEASAKEWQRLDETDTHVHVALVRQRYTGEDVRIHDGVSTTIDISAQAARELTAWLILHGYNRTA